MPFIPPAGSPLSAYTPPRPGALPPPPCILADRIDPATGDIATLLEGDHPVDAAIQWQFTVREGSGAAVVGGHRLHKITKATDNAKVQIADEGKRVMRPFIDRKHVRDVTITAGVIGESTATAALEVACKNVFTERTATARGRV